MVQNQDMKKNKGQYENELINASVLHLEKLNLEKFEFTNNERTPRSKLKSSNKTENQTVKNEY